MARILRAGYALGPADYQHPDGRDAVLVARGRFFEAIEDHAPQMIEELADRPLALARRIPGWTFERLFSIYTFADEVHWDGLRYSDDHRDPARARLRDALVDWGVKWKMPPSEGTGPDDNWCIEFAVQTLGCWIAEGNRFGKRPIAWGYLTADLAAYRYRGAFSGERWESALGRAIPIEIGTDEASITFPNCEWQPQMEPRDRFRTRQLEHLVGHLDAELDRIEAIAIERLTPTPRKHAAETITEDHFMWLVWRMVEGLTWPRIAERASRTNETVRLQVQELARLMALPLPPGRPGRPRHNL